MSRDKRPKVRPEKKPEKNMHTIATTICHHAIAISRRQIHRRKVTRKRQKLLKRIEICEKRSEQEEVEKRRRYDDNVGRNELEKDDYNGKNGSRKERSGQKLSGRGKRARERKKGEMKLGAQRKGGKQGYKTK